MIGRSPKFDLSSTPWNYGKTEVNNSGSLLRIRLMLNRTT